jgi:hypothetical protein
MQDQDPLYQYVRQVMLEIMAVLWSNGQTQLHVGAMMRLLGVPEEAAAKHDEERIEINEHFGKIIEESNLQKLILQKIPAGATVH